MILVRKRGTYHVEMHNDIDLDAFVNRETPFAELILEPGIEFYFNAEVAIVSMSENTCLPKYAKYLMDITFFENMDTEFSL